MFDFKHRIILKDESTIALFGEDYFCDKKVFWESHQTTLKTLCEKVCETGFPITIKNLMDNISLEIDGKKEFDSWLKENQPFECSC